MIFTDRTITVRKGESRIDEPIVVYRGDYELEVRFTILNSRFKFKSGVNMIESEKASYGQLAILTPYGGNIFSDIVRCNDGSVTFVLTADMLNQIEEVGLYSFQIRLMDYNKESRVSIPPIVFGIEVREPIASEDHDNSVNNAIVGYSIAKVVDPKEENVGDTFDKSGNYNKTKWETGDRISEGKLNKIEDAIDKVNQNEKDNAVTLSKRIDNNFNVLNTVKADKNEVFTMANMGQDIKEAMTGGSVAVVGENAILSDNIVDGQVGYKKTSFFKVIKENLYDLSKSTTGVSINHKNGAILSGSSFSHYCISDYIEVIPGSIYYTGPNDSNTHNVVFYDKNKNFISGIAGGWSNTNGITVPQNENIKYAIFTMTTKWNNSAYIYKDENYGYYIPYTSPIIEISESINNATEKIHKTFPHTFDDLDGVELARTNLFNKDTIIPHSILSQHDGSITEYPSDSTDKMALYCTSDYMPVIAGRTYTGCISDSYIVGYLALYDINKTFVKIYLGSGAWTGVITIPNDIHYVRVNLHTSLADQYMFMEGEELPYRYYKYERGEYIIDDDGLIKIIGDIPQNINTVPLESFTFMERVPGVNLVDEERMAGENTAVHNITGKIFVASNYIASDFIEVEEGETYCCVSTYNKAYYDENYTFIQGFQGGSWSNPFVIPDGVKYVRLTFKLNTQYMFVKGSVMPEYEPFRMVLKFKDEDIRKDILEALNINVDSDPLYGLTWNVLGDSITSTDYARPNWWEILASRHDMTVNGYGISGTTLAHHNERHLMDYHFGNLDAEEIGYIQSDPTTWATGNCMVERYVKMDDNADIITVMGGTNDNKVPLGSPSDTSTDTFYGACNVLFSGLIEKYPDKIVAIFTPIQGRNDYIDNIVGNLDAALDAKGPDDVISRQLRAEVIKRVARKYGLPVLDLYNESGFNGVGDRGNYLFRDDLHPSVEGNARLANIIENFLLGLL